MNHVEPQQLSELVANLEELARRNAASVTYSDVVRKFRLPELTEAWISQPLARVFENLDARTKRKMDRSALRSRFKQRVLTSTIMY